MIISIQNERVKYVRSLSRRRQRLRESRYVVEGTRLVQELIRAGVAPALVFYTQEWASMPEAALLLPSLERADDGAWLVSDAVLTACSDTESPQGVLAVAPIVDLAPRRGFVLILDRLRDPGNLGTILRSAQAAGVGQVVLAPGTVDPYNPKVVRGGMGVHVRLPIAGLGWPAIRQRVEGHSVWLADADGEVAYDMVDWRGALALIIGGEAAGAGEEAAGLATGRVSIPMAGGVESLNAAMAATILLFEAARQRRDR